MILKLTLTTINKKYMENENLQKYQEKLELIKTHFDINYLYITIIQFEIEVERKSKFFDNLENENNNLKDQIDDLKNEIDDLEAEIAKLKKQLKK
jgi:cell division protein FtsB